MAYKVTAETAPYSKKKPHPMPSGSKASYTPSGKPDEHGFGKDGGKPACLGTVPSVQVGGSFEVGTVPALPGTIRIGDNKNVSTPVSG